MQQEKMLIPTTGRLKTMQISLGKTEIAKMLRSIPGYVSVQKTGGLMEFRRKEEFGRKILTVTIQKGVVVFPSELLPAISSHVAKLRLGSHLS
ncbi:MAG TPA: hypothetical protein VF817_02420 [Patescibacteria group bacterium]